MADLQQQFDDAILAVLRAAREAGAGKLTRTQLTKFVYLLDLYVAEETGKATFTGAQWKFWHFGPFAAELDTRVDTLAAEGAIQSEARENVDKEYTLFYLGEWSSAKPLEALGLSHQTRTKLMEQLKLYRFDLPGLLNHVYFETAPMIGAKPGQPLDFAKAQRLDWRKDVRPYRFGVSDKAKANRIRELVTGMGKQRREQAFILTNRPIYDEHYLHAVADADFEPGDGPHRVKLDFE